MKKLYVMGYKLLLTVLIISMAISLNSCKTTSKENIAKAWRVESFNFEGQETFAESEPHQKIFKEFEEKASFDFNADGSYYFDMVTNKQKGSWSLENKTSLVTTSDDGIITKNKILELSEEKMVIEQVSDGAKITFTLVPKN